MSEPIDESKPMTPAVEDPSLEPTQDSQPKIMYVSWAESCSRSDHTARELGGTSHMVYLSALGSNALTIIPKYMGQFIMTAWLLLRQWPDAVIVMSPPLFAAMAPIIYCWITRRPYGLDCHTAAFMHPRFRRLQWLQAAMERGAAVNIVHNEHLRDVVVERGGRAVVVADVPVVYDSNVGETYPLSTGFNVTVVCSFNPDEPIAEILEAAKLTPDVQFYMTGNPKHLSSELKSHLPANVELTGFVSDAAYGSLLQNSGVVMSLTTRDHTMLRGAWEAIYQGTPVIVSNWRVLQEAFSVGALFVDNTAASIANAVCTSRDNSTALSADAGVARDQRQKNWQAVRQNLSRKLLGDKSPW